MITSPPDLTGRFHGFLKSEEYRVLGKPGPRRVVRTRVRAPEQGCRWHRQVEGVSPAESGPANVALSSGSLARLSCP